MRNGFTRFGVGRQLLRFSLVGISNVAIDVGLLTLLIRLTGIASGPWLVLFTTIAVSCAIINGYCWNGRWTFETRLNPRRQLLPFILVQVVGILVTDAIIALATSTPLTAGLGLYERVYIGKVLAVAVTAIWNFLALRRLVFV